ncbi:MAG: hypothetical protein IJA10_10690 [Lachnospiraceae bacterium]|nr:hypothetical protein [Lachnospiraceae bacterium]
MDITIRNITKDTMVDFNNDHTIKLPMNEEDLRKLLGDDEWIIVDSPIGEELTNITELNELLSEKDEETLEILQSAGYLLEEIKNGEFTIVDFDSETSQWNCGNGVSTDDWWKGYLLHDLGYIKFPFKYTEEMEDWVRFEALWEQADCEGWRETRYNNTTYLVNRY